MNENSPTPKCPRCGATVAADAPEGLCPRCLVALNLATPTEMVGEGAGPGGTRFVGSPPPPAPSPEEIARLFPQMEILECLGRGGMGAVYKARQPKLDRYVALKILLPGRQGGGQFAERFAREARALARLNHPDIVAVYDFGEAGGYPYLVMEYVDGLSLRQVLQRGKLAPEEALVIVPKICEALQFAHQQGIVHRDIKPENILMGKSGQVKIADFGIAKILAPGAQDRSLTGGKDVVGTPHYMAPEQVEQPTKVDHRADIFSLGVVFYEMLTGELPLGKFQPPSRKVQVDVRLDEVVLHALEKEPERRYQHAGQVKTAVETIAQSAPPPIGAAPSATQPDLWKRLQARFWPPLVGRRHGQRTINWPAVAMRGLRGLFTIAVSSVVGGLFFGMATQPHRGFGFGLGLFLGGLIVVGFVLTIRILRGFAVPFEFLAELNGTSAAVAAPAAGAPAPPAGPAVLSSFPGAMWFAAIVLGLMVLAKLLAMPLVGPKVLISAGLSAVLLAGLVMRAKWAYLLVMVGSAFGIFLTAAHGALPPQFHFTIFHTHVERLLIALITLLADALVVVPVLLSTRWFFPADYPDQKRQRWLWATAGTTALAALAGLFWPFPQSGFSAFGSPAAATSAPTLVQRAVDDIQPDGSVRFQITLEGMSWAEIATNEIINSDFLHVDQIKDGSGEPLPFEARPGQGGAVSYKITAPANRSPAEAASLIMEGTATGLVKATEKPDVFRYHMNHTPGDAVTRRLERHRLPAGALLLDKSPKDLREEHVGGRVELSLDRVIPPGGSLTVSYRYRLKEAAPPK
jgi:tRNA A-37 threonylcarbamoyl transferase component Bud32